MLINNYLKEKILNFVNSSQLDNDKLSYKFSKNDLVESPFALCFAKFIEMLLTNKIDCNHDKLYEKIIHNLKEKMRKNKDSGIKLITDKSFMQLLCFSLSLLSLISKNESSDVKKIINKILPKNTRNFIISNKLTSGEMQKGNLSMFYAIILYYKNLYIHKDDSIEIWFEEHEFSKNKNGFWGSGSDHYLQFQNGYHQYEIYYYFKKKINSSHEVNMYNLILKTLDKQNHFAPYYGGNSCYDYDAVFMLIFLSENQKRFKNNVYTILDKISENVIKEINIDGGFSDSKFIRPKNLNNLISQILFLLNSKNIYIFLKRLRFFITLQRKKYDKIETQFHNRKRDWSESNLWDTWFRVLLLAKIDNFKNNHNWNFIKFPGLGS